MTQKTTVSENRTNTELWSRVSLETGLWGLIGLLALGLRLWNLNHYPLTDGEAVHSLTAFNLYHGQQPADQLYSPLLLTLNTLSFTLFEAGNVSARLSAALLGSALVLLPALLRKQLGARVSLLAAGLLTISPSAIFLSRTVNSETGAAVGGLLLFIGLINWLDDRTFRGLWLAAGGLAVMLSAGPAGFSLMVIFAALTVARWQTVKLLVNRERPDTESLWIKPGLIFVIGLAVLATAAGFNLSGLGRVTAMPGDWLSQFGWQTPGGFNALFLLTMYEPLPLVFGLAGLVYAAMRPGKIETALAGWFGAALLLDAVMGGRAAGNIVLVLVPLTFLAAIALSRLWDSVQRWGRWDNEGILLGAGLIIGGFAFIGLTGWLERTCPLDDTFCQYSWLQAVAATLLFVVIVAFFAYLTDAGVALRGLGIVAAALGLLLTVNLSARLNYTPLPRLAFQPLTGVTVPTSGLESLAQTITDLSIQRTDSRNLLDVTLAGVDSPALKWQLRHFSNLAETDSALSAANTSVVITPANINSLSMQSPYLGQDFTLTANWSPAGLSAKEFIKWFIYRQTTTAPPGDRVIMWLRVDEN
jgi:hypothetical protein